LRFKDGAEPSRQHRRPSRGGLDDLVVCMSAGCKPRHVGEERFGLFAYEHAAWSRHDRRGQGTMFDQRDSLRCRVKPRMFKAPEEVGPSDAREHEDVSRSGEYGRLSRGGEVGHAAPRI
jgi:hypothetical protein